jgi:hypothetical protein
MKSVLRFLLLPFAGLAAAISTFFFVLSFFGSVCQAAGKAPARTLSASSGFAAEPNEAAPRASPIAIAPNPFPQAGSDRPAPQSVRWPCRVGVGGAINSGGREKCRSTR